MRIIVGVVCERYSVWFLKEKYMTVGKKEERGRTVVNEMNFLRDERGDDSDVVEDVLHVGELSKRLLWRICRSLPQAGKSERREGNSGTIRKCLQGGMRVCRGQGL
jgi:hypothetical protein